MLVFVFLPEPISGVFFHEPSAIATSVGYLIIVGFSEPFLCVELMTVGDLVWSWKDTSVQRDQYPSDQRQNPTGDSADGNLLEASGCLVGPDSHVCDKGVIFVCAFYWVVRKTRGKRIMKVDKNEQKLGQAAAHPYYGQGRFPFRSVSVSV